MGCINFEDWWNNYFFIATTILKMSYKDFLDYTPRQIKGLDILNQRYQQNLLLDVYITINKPTKKNSGKSKEDDVKVVSSFSDLF